MAHLNPNQQKAVEHIEGPLLVIAGAGSGKTRIVTFRIAHLIANGVPSSEILAVTFTNKAAEEMRHRVEKLCQQRVLTCTFHSLCARILRESISALGYQRDFLIYDEEDSEKLLKECIKEHQLEEKKILRGIQSAISQAKNNLIGPEQLSEDNPTAGNIYHSYQAKLKEYNAIDFDDMLFLTVRLFKEHPDILKQYQDRWTFVLVDEYQDTNLAQCMITRLLVARHHNIFAVGDPDQSIYSWRGANIHNILQFEKDFPGAKVITLDQNYRSTNTILSAANALIQNNVGRYEKKLWSDHGSGDKIGLYICENDHMEADFVLQKIQEYRGRFSLDDMVIFYRTNFQSRIFEDALLKRKIPYVIVGGLSFYQRREVKDILAFLRVVHSSADFLSVKRTINLPKRGIGDATIEKLQTFAKENGVGVFNVLHGIVEKKLDYKLPPKQLEGISSYVNLILRIRSLVEAKAPLEKIIEEAIEKSGYLHYIKEDAETYEERRANIAELVSKAYEWQGEEKDYSLSSFLEELSLKSSVETGSIHEQSVKLMTLHNGKGLEFSIVFLVGMEEELFPHMNAKGNTEAIEEERRLCYVGMTRAKEHLYLTASRHRFLWGAPRMMLPSRFLKEIPTEYLDILHKKHVEPISEDFSEGDIVKHKDFGLGIVQKRYNTSIGTAYDVFFPDSNTSRSLIAKYAKLVLVGHE